MVPTIAKFASRDCFSVLYFVKEMQSIIYDNLMIITLAEVSYLESKIKNLISLCDDTPLYN